MSSRPSIDFSNMMVTFQDMYTSKKHKLYVLSDPTTQEIRYVGHTVNLNHRLSQHLHLKNQPNCYKKSWIVSLLNRSIKPLIEEFDSFDTLKEVNDAEIFFIEYFRSIGCKLTNQTKGGGVVPVYKLSEEAAKEQKRKWHTTRGILPFCDFNNNVYEFYKEATKKLKISKSSLNKILSGKQDNVYGCSLRYLTPEEHELYKETGSIGEITFKIPEYSKFDWYSNHKKGVLHSEETKAKISETLLKNSTKEFKRKLAAGHGTKPFKDLNNNVYFSITEASLALNINGCSIGNVLRGKIPSTFGYEFKRLSEDEIELYMKTGSIGVITTIVPKNTRPRVPFKKRKPRSVEAGRKNALGKGLRPFQDNLGNIYYTLKEASLSLGVHTSRISKVLKKEQPHTCGYIFTFIEESL